MPNNASAKKRLRQNSVRRTRNRATKSVLRKSIREVREAVAAGNIEEASTKFRTASKRLDRAGAANLIHPNKASRTKSRLSKLIKAAGEGSS